MDQQPPIRRVATIVATIFSLTLAACGDDTADTAADDATRRAEEAPASTVASDGHPEASGVAEEVSTPVVRLAVTDADGSRLVLVDLADPAEVATLDLEAATTGLAVTEDGRYLAVGHDDGVTLVDGGAWTEAHGDHGHSFAGEPSILGEVAGASPSHMVSGEDRLALFFDGDGEAILLDEEALDDGDLVEVDRVASEAPHHGFALAAPDGAHVRTEPSGAPEGELPEQVVVGDPTGAALVEAPCPEAHGEAHTVDGAAAACGDGVLLLRHDGATWTYASVAYPGVDDADPYGGEAPRAWSLAATADGATLVGVLGARHLVVVDVATGTARAVTLDAAASSAGVVALDDGTAAVLTVDGALHVVDLAAGTVTATTSVLDAEPADAPDDAPTRRLAVVGEHVYVTDPATATATEAHVHRGEAVVEATIDLPVTPGRVAIVGA